MIIEISKTTNTASIVGGDAGPGTGDPLGQGNNYKWSLAIGDIEPDHGNREIVMQTLAGVMAVIGGVAQTTCQSVSLNGSGDYDGVHFAYGGSSELTVGTGQLQSIGSEIDFSSVEDPGFAEISKLPLGRFFAAPVGNVTSRALVINIIEEIIIDSTSGMPL